MSYPKLLLLLVAITMFSCSKEFTSEQVNSSEESNLTLDASKFVQDPGTIYGFMPSGVFKADGRLKLVEGLQSNYLRVKVNLETCSTDIAAIQKLQGTCKLIVTVGTNVRASPFPSNLEAYKDTLRKILTLCSPIEYLVIENEEMNENYRTGSMLDYKKELQAAISVAKEFNVPVTNGGLLFASAIFLTYQNYMQKGKFDKAKSFAARAVNPKILDDSGYIKPINLTRANIAQCDSLLKYYKNLSLDAVNIHIYYPMFDGVVALKPRVIKEVCNYLSNRTGKPVLSNESGQRDSDPTTTQTLMKEIKRAGMKYCIWFGGDGDAGAYGLYDAATLTLRETGATFREVVMSNK